MKQRKNAIIAKMFIRKNRIGPAVNVFPNVRQISRFCIVILNVLNAERTVIVKKKTRSIIIAIQILLVIMAHAKYVLMVGMKHTGAKSANAKAMPIAGRESIAIYITGLMFIVNLIKTKVLVRG